MGKKRPLLINPYLSYGTTDQLNAHGRALEDRSILFNTKQSIFKTLANIYKQFESNEIPNATVQLTIANGTTFDTITDLEGYYEYDQNTKKLDQLTNSEGWLSYTVRYLQYPSDYPIQDGNLFSGEMLIPNTRATYGVISDIDDTILHTGVSSLFKWRMIANTLFKNFDQRIPLKGAADFYQKLHYDENGLAVNPIFYVSNSPWNLYDYLQKFLHKSNFPKGPVLLRDFWIPFDKIERSKIPHKRQEITRILDTYPELNFILIGDSGEKDPIYYSEIATQYPGRILAIYLHAVKNKKKRQRTLEHIESFDAVPMLMVETSDEISRHAKSLGLMVS